MVTSQYTGGSDAQKLMTAIAGGDPPDVIMQDRFTIGEWAARGAFLSLNKLIAASQRAETDGRSPAIDPQEFYSACWMEAVYDGERSVLLNMDTGLCSQRWDFKVLWPCLLAA